MNDKGLHIIYTAEDIDRYFSGKLLPAEMHAMEKAALDDPFLADAMEGYEAMKDMPWKPALAEAKNAIAGGGKEQKVIPVVAMFPWKKAVAAVLIIGCGVALTYQLTNNSSSKNKVPEIASVTKVATVTDSANKDTGHIDIAAAPAQQDMAVTTQKNKPDLSTQTEREVQDVDNTAAERSVKSNTLVAEKKTRRSTNDDEQWSDSILEQTAPVASAAANIAQANDDKGKDKALMRQTEVVGYGTARKLNHRFVAEVLAPDKTPLPFANVQVKQDNFGTYADVKGKFRLVGEDSLLTVEVNAAGYMPQTYTLKSNTTANTIILNEVPLDTKNIVRLKNKKAASPNAANRHGMLMDTVIDVEPADGWSNYDTYLSNNLTPSEEVRKNNIHGEVEVSFDVQSNGMASNVNITRSLCAACDEEALRVIKAGPQWKVKKGKKEKGKVKVKF